MATIIYLINIKSHINNTNINQKISSVPVARNNLFFVIIGLGVGASGGILLGMWIARPHFTSPVMKAIVCFSYKDDVSNKISAILLSFNRN